MATYVIEYKRSFFSRREIRDIFISVIALSIALELAYRFIPVYIGLSISFLMVITAFFLHEMAHKFTAIRLGAWSEFRMWPLGVLLTLVTSLLGFIFALPGAVYFASYRNPRIESKIALAGPTTNIILGIIMLLVLTLIKLHGLILVAVGYLAFINIWLAFFNLLPIPPLDGSKIFRFDRLNWGLAIAVSGVMLIYFWLNFSIILY